MSRPETAKDLAARIDITYHRRRYPFRRWLWTLCAAAFTVVALWLILMTAQGREWIYMSGPVATAHAMFDSACDRCHRVVPRPERAVATNCAEPVGLSKPFQRTSDGACLGCHDGPVHQQTQICEPTCAHCHLEHKGRSTLARVTDRHCTKCHENLETTAGASKFARVVSLAQHPEFRKRSDVAKIKLNHEQHVEKVKCVSCHQADAAGKYMLPIKYESHCGSSKCHEGELRTTLNRRDVLVPHDNPEVIRGFLLAKLLGPQAIPAAVPKETDEGPSERPSDGTPISTREWVVHSVSFRGLGSPVDPDPHYRVLLVQRSRAGEAPADDRAADRPVTAPGATEQKAAESKAVDMSVTEANPTILKLVTEAEKLLFNPPRPGPRAPFTGCELCHVLRNGDQVRQFQLPPNIPRRWLTHAAFDHRAHRPLACRVCHEAALKSRITEDVLLPGIDSCRDCHRNGNGARADCVECHTYHDRAKERSSDGPWTVPDILRRRMPTPVIQPAVKGP